MSGRQILLAEIAARQRSAVKDEIDVLAVELSIASDDNGYNPYDKPGHAKPLTVDGAATIRRKALKPKRR
jgi:hypothetical protein